MQNLLTRLDSTRVLRVVTRSIPTYFGKTWPSIVVGDINLSVTMTFFSSVSSFLMTTLWIYLLGTPLVAQQVPIPYAQLVIALVSFVIPIGRLTELGTCGIF